MYKLLIADDEAIERKAFKTIIANDIPEISEFIEAANGNEAVEAAVSQRPDIIIMDVKMPGINGIDALRKIMEAGVCARTVVLTAYDDFNYVQQALEMGVNDYLLKPSRRAKIVDVLTSLISSIKKETKKKNYDAEMVEKMSRIGSVIENQMVALLPQASIMITEVEDCLDFLGIDRVRGHIMAFSSELSNDDYPVRFLYNKDLYDRVYEALHQRFECAVAYPASDKVFAVVFTEFPEGADSQAEEIAASLSKQLGQEVFWGASAVFSHVKEMEEAYFQALQAINGDCLFEEPVTGEQMPEYVLKYLFNKEEIFLQRFKALNEKESLNAIDEIFLWLFKNMTNDIWLARNFTMGVLSLCIKHAAEMGMGRECFSLIMGKDYFSEIIQVTDLWKLKKSFENIVIELLVIVRRFNAEKVAGVIEKAQTYISENFASDITLEKVASYVNISPTYLSRLFKRQNGINFVEYITKVRINKAKDLLKNSDFPVKQISYETGFNDPNYFFKVFKSVVGVTPGEYRNS